MERHDTFGPDRFIWKKLPLHPHPQPLESFSSYVTRLAEANGLKSVNELAALARTSVGFQVERSSPDYPHRLHIGLAEVTGCSLALVQSTTFFHIGQHFGVPAYSRPLQRFLQSSLAKSLRYCPHCLAQHSPPYYSLIWRFAAVHGCIEHGCMLLDQCGHCGSSVPFFALFPQLLRCPTCQGDLRICRVDQLPKELVEITRMRTDDLEMLLTPTQWTAEAVQAKTIGKRFAFLRQQRKFSATEVALRMGANERVVLDIEHTNWYREALFSHYMQYADILESSLREIFNVDALQKLLVPLSEEEVLEQVKAAIQQLQARGEPVIQGNIADIVGMPASRLKQYPLVQSLLNRYRWEHSGESAKSNSQREDELVKQVEQIIKQLEARGETVVQERICALVGMTRKWINQYPRIKALFRQYQESRPKRQQSPRVDEEEKVQQVQAVIDALLSRGEPVTRKRILQMVRLTQKQLEYSPHVKSLLAQHTGRGRQEV